MAVKHCQTNRKEKKNNFQIYLKYNKSFDLSNATVDS